MKIKQVPDDFQVNEVTDLVPSGGPFALYRLEKVGWTTHDAINTIRRRWNIPFQVLSYGGLKDRHARTAQHLTIENGPTTNLEDQGISLVYLGQSPQAFTSDCIRANRFVVVVRDLTSAQVEAGQQAVEEVRKDGIANYFDDQRFGSVADGGDFIGRCMVLEKWEEALKLALTAPYEFDRSAEKKQKAILRQHWGDWRTCVQKLKTTHARRLGEHLAGRPSDFRGAIGMMRADLTGLYISAYQSHLWNRFLSNWLSSRLSPERRISVTLKLDAVPFPRGLDAAASAELNQWSLPLPSARLKYEDAISETPPDWPEILRQTLSQEQIELNQIRLNGLRRPFFSRGERAILSHPANLHYESGADELHPGRFKATLAFEMLRGTYATLLVKRLFA